MWVIEYSEYSDKKGMYPFHVSKMDEAISGNLRDFLCGNRKENKWQIIYWDASWQSCQDHLEILLAQRRYAGNETVLETYTADEIINGHWDDYDLDTYIYALIDPRDSLVRYIGQTRNLDQRLAHHVHSPLPSLFGWIARLLDVGMKPRIKVLCAVNTADALRVEREWIQIGIKRGWPLLNRTGLGGLSGSLERLRKNLKTNGQIQY